MTPAMYPPIIAFLNLLGLFFLVLGRNQIKKGHRGEHKKLMLCALVSGHLFDLSRSGRLCALSAPGLDPRSVFPDSVPTYSPGGFDGALHSGCSLVCT